MPKDTTPGIISIEKINFGGLAHSKWSGVKNSLYKLIGFDPHSTPGILKVAQKLSKDSGATIDEFCKVGVNCSNGIRYWFSSTSGKIWQEKAGTYTLVYTTSPAAGTALCSGAAEYQGYLYWATQSRLHRIPIASSQADGSAAWTANAVPNWATFSITDADFHPMLSHTATLILYIGDGNYVAQVDGSTFTANALDIKTPLRTKSLGEIGTDLLIGTYVADTVNKTEIIRWNTWSVSFTNSDSIDEVGINAFLPADNFVFLQAGLSRNIYIYDGEKLELYKKIPGDYSPTEYGTVNPYSVGNLAGQILFGFYNGSGNPADELVYRIARADRDHPYIMDAPFPISERSGGEFVLSGIEIGAILVSGFNVYVAWKNGSSYGVDKLDWSTKLDGAYFETRVAIINRESFINVSKVIMAFADLPASTAITIQYSKNYAAYVDTTEVNDTDRNIVYSDIGVEATTIQVKIAVTTSVNDAPEIESGAVVLQ